jgi:hypothetical protein
MGTRVPDVGISNSKEAVYMKLAQSLQANIGEYLGIVGAGDGSNSFQFGALHLVG